MRVANTFSLPYNVFIQTSSTKLLKPIIITHHPICPSSLPECQSLVEFSNNFNRTSNIRKNSRSRLQNKIYAIHVSYIFIICISISIVSIASHINMYIYFPKFFSEQYERLFLATHKHKHLCDCMRTFDAYDYVVWKTTRWRSKYGIVKFINQSQFHPYRLCIYVLWLLFSLLLLLLVLLCCMSLVNADMFDANG